MPDPFIQAILQQKTVKSEEVSHTLTTGENTTVFSIVSYATNPEAKTIQSLYNSPLPQMVLLLNVKVISSQIYTDSKSKSFIEVKGDDSVKTIKCWFYYKDFPINPAVSSKINIYGKPYETPKIDILAISIVK